MTRPLWFNGYDWKYQYLWHLSECGKMYFLVSDIALIYVSFVVSSCF